MNDQKPTPSDPTPERRVGDVSIRPVIIVFAVTILIILIAAIIFIKARQTKVTPNTNEARPTSQTTPPAAPLPTPLQRTLAA